MKEKLFMPNNEAAEQLGIGNISYVYATGSDLVATYGNVFKVRVIPYIHYLVLSCSDVLDLKDPFICSNKYDYEDHPNKKEEYLAENSFKTMYNKRMTGGMPSNVHGKKCILIFPFGFRCPFVFDIETEQILPIIKPEMYDIEGIESLVELQTQVYGDCTDLFPPLERGEFKQLHTLPCNEFACIDPVEYIIATGWQIVKYHTDKIHMEKINRRVRYLVILVHDKKGTKEFIYSNKWDYGNHTKIEDWMREPGAHNKMLNNVEFSGMPCNINGHKTIVCYPFMVYNPVIWDIEDDSVYCLPSRAVSGDHYYNKLFQKYGAIR